MRRILSLLLALFPVRAACQPLFPCAERLQSPYGVCTHTTRPGWDYEIRDRELQLLAETGIRWVRSDLAFHRFFTSPTATDPAVFSRVLDSRTIISSQREQVKLEENIHLLQAVIIF